MDRNAFADLARIKAALYARARSRPDELALASHRLLSGPPEPARWNEALDFFAIEWVDAGGWTEVERAVNQGEAPVAAAEWARDVRTALWVVDGWEGPRVLLRDIANDEEIAVWAEGAEASLTRRTVLRARVLPWAGDSVFSGDPDVFGEMGVIGRLDLLRLWREGPEPALHEELKQLRAAFRRQRDERDAFVRWFGSDTVVWGGADAMEAALLTFLAELRGEGDRSTVRLGPSLLGEGRHGAIFDESEGIHFLPSLGEFFDAMAGEPRHADVLRGYLDDPGVTALPFRRAPSLEGLRRLRGRSSGTIDDLVAPEKNPAARAHPSVLPGPEDD